MGFPFGSTRGQSSFLFAIGVGSELLNEEALSQDKSSEVIECARQLLQAVRQARAGSSAAGSEV